MSYAISEDCSSELHDCCTRCECPCHNNGFEITLEEARILNQWLRLHHGLFKEQPDYIHLLRLINGIGSFVDKYDR